MRRIASAAVSPMSVRDCTLSFTSVLHPKLCIWDPKYLSGGEWIHFDVREFPNSKAYHILEQSVLAQTDLRSRPLHVKWCTHSHSSWMVNHSEASWKVRPQVSEISAFPSLKTTTEFLSPQFSISPSRLYAEGSFHLPQACSISNSCCQAKRIRMASSNSRFSKAYCYCKKSKPLVPTWHCFCHIIYV